MEENLNETLGIKESKDKITCTDKSDKIDSGAEDILNFFAKLVLILGIISAFIFFMMAFSERGRYGQPEFNIIGLVYAILCIVSSLLTWSVMRVFANISLTLKEINKKIK